MRVFLCVVWRVDVALSCVSATISIHSNAGSRPPLTDLNEYSIRCVCVCVCISDRAAGL